MKATFARIRRIVRWLVPKRPQVGPPRDLLADNRSRSRAFRSVFTSSLAIVPAIGILAMVLNVFFRARGNSNLALAIIVAIPISSLAMIVVLGLINFLLIGATNALATLAGQDESTPRMRHFAGTALLIAIVIGLVSLPWMIFLGLILSSYVYWRSERVGRRVKGVPIGEWARGAAVPIDIELRALWNEARWLLKRGGETLPEVDSMPIKQPVPFRLRRMEDVFEDVRNRQKAIAAAAPKSGSARLVNVLLASLGIFWVQLVATPINFAPLQLVTFADGETYRGFALDTQHAILFIDSTLTRGRYLPESDVRERVVCSPASSTEPLPKFLIGQSGVAEIPCSDDRFDWPENW